MKRFLIKNIRTLIVDLIASFLAVGSFILEYNCFLKCSNNIPLYNANIIVSLLPAIVTIISISLQLHDDRIFNIKIRDYQKLRKNHFNLLHMVLVTSIIFAIELVVQILSKPITAITISAIAFIYAIIFSIFELPILMKNENAAIRIIKSNLNNQSKLTQEESDIYENALKNYIVERGIKDAFSKLNNFSIKDNELLDFLLSKYNDFLVNYINNATVYKENDFLNDNEEDALTVLNSCFKNISDLLDINNYFNYLIFDKDGMNVYHLTRLTFSTHKLSSLLDYDNEIPRLKRIMNFYYWRKDRKVVPALFVNYISVMMVHSICNGEDWFLKAYRDFDYSSFFSDIPENIMDYFLLMLICYVVNSRYVSPDNKKLIYNLINERKGGLNASGFSWKDTIARSIENHNDPDMLLFALKDFLALSKKLKENSCDIIPDTLSTFSYDDNTHFSVGLIIDYWFQILLFHPYLYFDHKSALVFLKELPIEDGDIIAKVIENRFADYRVDNSGAKPTPFFDILFDPIAKKSNKTLEDVLNEFLTFHNSRVYEKDHHRLTNDILISLKKQEDEAVKNCLSSYTLNKDIKFEENDVVSRNIWLEGEKEDFTSLLDLYLKELKFSINQVIINTLKHDNVVTLFDGTNYPSNVIEKIIKFKPETMGKHEWKLNYSCSTEQVEQLKIDDIERVDYIPKGMFAKKNAISINIEYCEKASDPRFATNEEINNIIDTEYVATNGLYTFSQYKGIKNGSFFVTREELFSKLKDRIIIVPLVLKIKVVSDKEKIVYFESKKE